MEINYFSLEGSNQTSKNKASQVFHIRVSPQIYYHLINRGQFDNYATY